MFRTLRGLGFDRMMDCFDFTEYSESDLLELASLKPIIKTEALSTLIDYSDTQCFSMERYKSEVGFELSVVDSYSVLVIIKGTATVSQKSDLVKLEKGDQLFVSADHSKVWVQPEDGEFVEVIRCLPPKK